MSTNNLSTLVLRVGISAVYLWFGIQQFMYVEDWIGYLPEWTTKFATFTQAQFIYANATLEVTLGTFLLLGFFTRLSALILAVHLAVITYEVGYNQVGVRDFGLTLATLAIALSNDHPHTIDNKYLAFLKNKFPGFGKSQGKH